MASELKIGRTVDCAEPDLLASFWERFVGYRRRTGASGDTYVTIDRPDGVEGPPHLTFQKVPEPKVEKARLHLDLFVDHARPMFDEMIAAGATAVTTTEAGGWTTRILRDPAGNEFCVIGPD